MNKGQVSIEIMFAVGMMLFIFIFMLAYSFNKKIDVTRFDNVISAKGDCTKLSTVMTAAFLNGNNPHLDKIGDNLIQFFIILDSSLLF